MGGDRSKGLELFESKSKPIFAVHGYKCHSHDADTITGGLLDAIPQKPTNGGDYRSRQLVPGKTRRKVC
jgi:hypothetical protein